MPPRTCFGELLVQNAPPTNVFWMLLGDIAGLWWNLEKRVPACTGALFWGSHMGSEFDGFPRLLARYFPIGFWMSRQRRTFLTFSARRRKGSQHDSKMEPKSYPGGSQQKARRGSPEKHVDIEFDTLFTSRNAYLLRHTIVFWGACGPQIEPTCIKTKDRTNMSKQ